jgi:hypothetical protein
MTPEELRAARKARARRWLAAGYSMNGYPAVHADDETEETLAAEPPKQAEKKAKPQAGDQPPSA